MPSMLKQDQSVFVVAENLDYDGTASTATYTGSARLVQGETSIKGDSIGIDNKGGNLTASGSVATAPMLKQSGRSTKRAKDANDDEAPKPSRATAKALKYTDAERQAIHTGDAHLSRANGDVTRVR